jgi:hypothetical protein
MQLTIRIIEADCLGVFHFIELEEFAMILFIDESVKKTLA